MRLQGIGVRWRRSMWGAGATLLFTAQAVWARPEQMHIMEGFLPPLWAAIWFLVALPFWFVGIRRISRLVSEKPEMRLLLGLSGAFCLLLSALKIPSVTGSSSHPTGTGLGTILFGPAVMSVLGGIVLLFQALLLAHGGITTLGANSVSMAVVGPIVGWLAWRAFNGRSPGWLAVFVAAALADLSTYVVTALQLALAYPDPIGGIGVSFVKFGVIFAVTQIPLSISEGILTVLVVNALRGTAESELKALGVKEA